MEHRNHDRLVQSGLATMYSGDSPATRCRIQNLSAGGMFVDVPERRYAPNAALDVEFAMGQRHFRLAASVVGTRPSGMGLRFLADGADQQTLRRLLSLATAERAAIELATACALLPDV